MNREKHPFKPFVPLNAQYLIIGSFPCKKSTQNKILDDWYYGSSKNQFWRILQEVYGRELSSKHSKQELFKEKRIALTDVVLSCIREDNNSADKNLVNIEYNTEAIEQILNSNQILKIYFTGKGVLKQFKKYIYDSLLNIDGIELIALPSPSPIYYRMKLKHKVRMYKKLTSPHTLYHFPC